NHRRDAYSRDGAPVRQQGKGNTVQRIDEGVRTTQHIAALRVLEGADGDWAYALCGATPGDGLGGLFSAAAAGDPGADGSGTIVTPHGIGRRRQGPGPGGAPLRAYPGQRTIGESEVIPAGGFLIAHEIPVTIADGMAYSLSWLLGVQVGISVAVRSLKVRFYL